MVATKERTSTIRRPSNPMLAGRLAAPNESGVAPGAGRLAAMADTALKGRLSDDPDAFVEAVRQQPGE